MTDRELNEIIATLERTPGTLRSLLEGLPESLYRHVPKAGAWSAFDVVGHLIHGDKTDWIPRLRKIITEGDAQIFKPFDRSAFFRETEGKSLDELLTELASLRSANLDTLRDLQARGIDVEAVGTHPELGRVTAGELLATWATHDLGHIAQAARAMARRHGDGTGPWRAYLPVLKDS